MADGVRLRALQPLPVRQLAGETVVVDPRRRRVFVMNRVGALVWDAAGRQASVGEVVRTVVGRFRVDGQTARLDVARFVGELQQAGLVELLPAEAEGPLDARSSASVQPGGPVGGGA
jgi:hypothetical protein